MSYLLLPHHDSLTSLDPLGIDEHGEGRVTHHALLTLLLDRADYELRSLEDGSKSAAEPGEDAAWSSCFRRLLEDIAYSLHGDHSLSTDALTDSLQRLPSKTTFRETLFRSARQLTSLFTTGQLPYLSAETPIFVCSAATMDALLAHMLLGTYQIPEGNTWGRPSFSQYYDGTTAAAVQNTAPAYLETIVAHFAKGGYASSLGHDQSFTFHRSHAIGMPDPLISELICPQIPTKIVQQPQDPSARSDAFVLVAANPQPGPGPAGTHEERINGQSPALAIVSLIKPLLAAEEAIVTSPLPVHTAWDGHGREARMTQSYQDSQRPWRRYIVADALQLDVDEKETDLANGNILREVQKLYASFDGAKQAWLATGKPLEQMEIEMPPWGCGVFGGNLGVKVQCMMIAAGLAGLKTDNLELLAPPSYQQDLLDIPQDSLTVRQLYERLVPDLTFSEGESSSSDSPSKRAAEAVDLVARLAQALGVELPITSSSESPT